MDGVDGAMWALVSAAVRMHAVTPELADAKCVEVNDSLKAHMRGMDGRKTKRDESRVSDRGSDSSSGKPLMDMLKSLIRVSIRVSDAQKVERMFLGIAKAAFVSDENSETQEDSSGTSDTLSESSYSVEGPTETQYQVQEWKQLNSDMSRV